MAERADAAIFAGETRYRLSRTGRLPVAAALSDGTWRRDLPRHAALQIVGGKSRDRAHPAATHRHRLLPDRRGVRRTEDDLRQRRGRPLYRRSKEGPDGPPYPSYQRPGTAGPRPR